MKASKDSVSPRNTSQAQPAKTANEHRAEKAAEDAAPLEDLRTIEDERFSREMEMLIERGEEMRLQNSRSYSTRQRLFNGALAFMVMGTAIYLVWYILMGGQTVILQAAIAATLVVPLLLHNWAQTPYKNYIKNYKTRFMPQLAELMGGMKFHPTGGISRKTIMPAQILPPHNIYESEDCFVGKYEGVGMLISEARLYKEKKRGNAVFDGVFVLLTTPKRMFKGHTIITSAQKTARRWNNIRWKTLAEVPTAESINAGNFLVFSDTPDEARQLADEDMMALLHKLSDLFNQSDISAVFYGGNKVFMMIPYEEDMFEPGDIFIPVSTQKHALKCKREIEQFLNVIDILNVYEGDETL